MRRAQEVQHRLAAAASTSSANRPLPVSSASSSTRLTDLPLPKRAFGVGHDGFSSGARTGRASSFAKSLRGRCSDSVPRSRFFGRELERVADEQPAQRSNSEILTQHQRASLQVRRGNDLRSHNVIGRYKREGRA